MTLRWRLTLAFVLVVVVPLLIGAAIVSRAFPREVQAEQRVGAQTSSRLVAQVLRDYCDRARATAEAAGRAAAGVDAIRAQVAITSLVDRGLADAVEVTGPRGVVVATAGSPLTTATRGPGAPVAGCRPSSP